MSDPIHQDGPRYQFSTDIPDNYGEARLRVMHCNPHQVFVYWEIPPRLQERYSSFTVRGREYHPDHSFDTASFSEFGVDPMEQGCYVEIQCPGVAFVFELCGLDQEGKRTVITTAGHEITAQCSPDVAEEREDSLFLPQGVMSRLPYRSARSTFATPANIDSPDTAPSSWTLFRGNPSS